MQSEQTTLLDEKFFQLLKNKHLFLFIAPPNGGKGTQTQILSESYGLPVFDMGATFRAILKEGRDPELKNELDTYMSQGQLVPVKTVLAVFKKYFLVLAEESEEKAKQNHQAGPKGFILDGFPRNTEQAQGLFRLLYQHDSLPSPMLQPGKLQPGNKVFTFFLNVPDALVKKRAIGRRFCSLNARHVYNIDDPQLRPKQKKMKAGQSSEQAQVETDPMGREIYQCDIDGADLIIRSDDEPSTVEKRLNEYHKETDPLVQFFQNPSNEVPTEAGLLAISMNPLFEIEGQQRPEQVTAEIRDKLDTMFFRVVRS